MKRVWIVFICAAVIGSSAATWAGEGSFGDFNRDDDVDLYDYYALQICLGFSGPDFLVPATCGVFDLKADGDVDLEDVSAFLATYSGTSSTLHVEAGGLVPISATFGSYYSGEPGKSGQNALNGIAAQAGFTQADFWYQWSVDAQPEFSGQVVLSNASKAATAFTILPRTLPGNYVFQLSVTNLNTGEMAADFVALDARCISGQLCDDGNSCTIDNCRNGDCVSELFDCDDGIACTQDECVPESGGCVHKNACPNSQVCDHQSGGCRDIVCESDAQCDDGQFCNGMEVCTIFSCVAGSEPCAAEEACDEINDRCGPRMVATRSSGPAQPTNLVTIGLDDEYLPDGCKAAAIWTQTSGPPVTLSHLGNGSAIFIAPIVSITTNLSFTVNIPGTCSVGARIGTVTVQIQVANATLNLPATIALNTSLILLNFTAVGGAPGDFLTLYFVEVPLPEGVSLEIDQINSTLMVTSGVGRRIRIFVQIFAAAGLLDEASDTIDIVAGN